MPYDDDEMKRKRRIKALDSEGETLGETIHYPGSNRLGEDARKDEEESVWEKFKKLIAPKAYDRPESPAQTAGSGNRGPSIDPEKARKFQKGFFGK